MSGEKYSLGLDFGTDSVRASLVNVRTGEEFATFVSGYLRWKDKEFCDPSMDQYRQHPRDYIESMTSAVKGALGIAAQKTGDRGIGRSVIGIGIDTTGSTPVAVDKNGVPLAMYDEFRGNPDAMFILWKDHTALEESEQINRMSQKTDNGKYTQYVGGTYSPEWFWSKVIHTLRKSSPISNAAYSWVEHCDWMPAMLSNTPLSEMKRSRCAAGHKALWHESWKMPFEFLGKLCGHLEDYQETMGSQTYTSDQVAGKLSREWAENLGLAKGTPIGVGAFDAHMGAVGNGIKPGTLSRIVGTSTCDMVVAPYQQMIEQGREKLIKGICGQVDGSIIPGMYGLEAGRSAVGDIFANFAGWIRDSFLRLNQKGNIQISRTGDKDLSEILLADLSDEANQIPIGDITKIPLVLGYHNGRRTPNADQRLTGAAFGLTLGTSAVDYFAGLVHGTCYTGRQIMETFTGQGIKIDDVIACGGIADKNQFVMQTMADVFGVPIRVAKSDQTCALGAAMFGAVVGGAYKTVEEAQEKMGSGFKARYTPRRLFNEVHNKRFNSFREAVDSNEELLRELK
jgi:L-ribulokinase